MKKLIAICLAIFLVACEKQKEVMSEESSVVTPKPAELTAMEKRDLFRNSAEQRIAFTRACDNNGGVKSFEPSRYSGKFYSAPFIECNNGLSMYFKE